MFSHLFGEYASDQLFFTPKKKMMRYPTNFGIKAAPSYHMVRYCCVDKPSVSSHLFGEFASDQLFLTPKKHDATDVCTDNNNNAVHHPDQVGGNCVEIDSMDDTEGFAVTSRCMESIGLGPDKQEGVFRVSLS